MNIHFSDRWWIDAPCFILTFVLTIYCSIAFAIIIEYMFGLMTDPGSFADMLIAPVVEELFKFLTLLISISTGVAFTLIFSLAEMHNFITFGLSNFEIVGYDFIIMRIICVGFHFVTLSFQIYGLIMYRKYNRLLYLILGYLLAVFLHFEWNAGFGGLIYNQVKHILGV